jgi:2,3-diketo-5-methylthiopentyl-1-phosphate enolase
MLGIEIRTAYDGIDASQMIIATYYMEVGVHEDVIKRIKSIARFVYPGAWLEPLGATPTAWEKHSARIISIYETPPNEISVPRDVSSRHFIFQLGIPIINVDKSLATLLTTVAGEILAYGNIKLLDLYFPDSYIQRFPGPKFGIEGIRQRLKVFNRPLLLAIMKPSQGYTPQTGANAFREAAIGGADIIKDEELLSNPDYCPRVERIKLYIQAERQAYEATGEHTLYAVNITDQPHKLLDNALEAVELGANALMLNYLQVGLDAARIVCEDPRIQVPILGHNSGATSLFASSHTGMSSTLISAKLPRLCGVDMGIVLSGLGSFPGLQDRCLLLARELLSPLKHIHPILPLVASGVTTDLVASMIQMYGTDIALGAGTTIFGYQNGATHGAKALRDAIDEAIKQLTH